MRIDRYLTDQAVLAELGRRIAQTRLERNMAQAELGERAGVGLATIQRLERGRSVASTSLIRVLRVLDLLDDLERAVPEPLPSPLEQLKLRGRRRQRAGRPRDSQQPSSGEAQPWRWADEGDET